MVAPTASSHDPYAALRLPPFRWFVSSMLTMTLGAQIQGVVVGWQVYDLTKDPLSLGLMGLAEALPYALAAYNAGPSRVTAWRKKTGTSDPELFVERIPFVETRDYVRIVQRNRDLYQALYEWK